MIVKIVGKVIEKDAKEVWVDVNGITYSVIISESHALKAPREGELVVLYTHVVYKDVSQEMYGFATKQEQRLFKLLIKVNGIGPKCALNLLSNISPNRFYDIVLNKNLDEMIKVPGIGKKTASRLLLECLPMCSNSIQFDGLQNKKLEAINALVSLGYKVLEAKDGIEAVYNDKNSLEEIIMNALKNFGSKK